MAYEVQDVKPTDRPKTGGGGKTYQTDPLDNKKLCYCRVTTRHTCQ